MGSGFDENLLGEFIAESREHLDAIEPDLLELEGAGEGVSADTVNRVFRAIHSIKGGAGFLAFDALKKLSHSMENVLMLVRDGKLALNAEITDLLLRGVDKLRAMLDDLQASDGIPCEEELAAFDAILRGEAPPPSQAAPAAQEAAVDVHDVILSFGLTADQVRDHHRPGRFLFAIQIDTGRDLDAPHTPPKALIQSIESVGTCIACTADLAQLREAESSAGIAAHFGILVSSVLEPDLMVAAVDIPSDAVTHFELPSNPPPTPAQVQEAAEVANVDRHLLGQILVDQFKVAQTHVDEAIARQQAGDNRPIGAILMTLGAVSPKVVADAVEHQHRLREESQRQSRASQPAQAPPETLRVRVDLLSRLLNNASELVLARNRLMRALEGDKERVAGLGDILQNVDFITTELQEGIMQTRLQPIGSVFGRFPRVVRDIARQLGKQIELATQGSEVELDKSIIEALSDPLTHLVRNSADHGIETPDERKKAGKAANGTILMRAVHEGGQVCITITDDGHGIDAQKVAKKAIEKGILKKEDAATASECDLLKLIFAPGFSTAEKVSDVSGRGVGMDVVRTNIERLGGTVQVESRIGEGTTIQLQLPLTLAIIPSIVVGVGSQRFAIPQVSVEEFVWVRSTDVKELIERFHGQDVLRLRGSLLPLVRLSQVLGIEETIVDPDTLQVTLERRQRISDRRSSDDSGDRTDHGHDRLRPDRRTNWRGDYNVVVIKHGSNRFGLIVDTLFDTEEIVVKPLSTFLKQCNCYSGSTILGDGRVILILDVFGLASLAGLHFADLAAEAIRREEERQRAEAISARVRRSVVLFAVAEDEYFAVPQDTVLRVERINPQAIQLAGGNEYIEYRGRGLQLIRLDRVLPVQPMPAGVHQYIIIPKVMRNNQPVAGFMVSRIVDALDIDVELESSPAASPGLEGTAVVDNRLTLFLEPFDLLRGMESLS